MELQGLKSLLKTGLPSSRVPGHAKRTNIWLDLEGRRDLKQLRGPFAAAGGGMGVCNNLEGPKRSSKEFTGKGYFAL